MTVPNIMYRWGRKLIDRFQTQADLRQEYDRIRCRIEANTPNNPAIYGYKVYSQCDEDGILAHIFNKIRSGRTFLEIGCGDGTENNTHALLLSGWRGAWIDADERNIQLIDRAIPRNSRLVWACERISEDNAVQVATALLTKLAVSSMDLLSLDIDSVDVYVLESMLQSFAPKVVCVEYNAKFPPPMLVAVRRATKTWSSDDYQGASLASFVKATQPYGYTLVACNISGANAFFVQNEFSNLFPSYTPEQLYQPARYELIRLMSGHPPSLKYLADMAEGDTSD